LLRTALVAAGALGARPAWGHGPDEWWLPVGASVGYAAHADEDVGGVLAGGEISLAHAAIGRDMVLPIPELWYGGYLDVVYDAGVERTRIGFGPEVGYAFFGADGGLVVEVGEGVRFGAAIRLLAMGPFVALFARQGFMGGDPGGTFFTEVGALAKLPVPLSRLFD
jgi:hypothetical protein